MCIFRHPELLWLTVCAHQYTELASWGGGSTRPTNPLAGNKVTGADLIKLANNPRSVSRAKLCPVAKGGRGGRGIGAGGAKKAKVAAAELVVAAPREPPKSEGEILALLRESIQHQDDALKIVAQIASHCDFYREDIKPPVGPKVASLFGVSGSGKTATVDAVAKLLQVFGTPAYVKIRLGEYKSEADATRLIGSADGNIGFGHKGSLIERLRAGAAYTHGKGWVVLLIDEVDKGTPDIMETVMELLDKGEIGDLKLVRFACFLCGNYGEDDIIDYFHAHGGVDPVPPAIMLEAISEGCDAGGLEKSIQGRLGSFVPYGPLGPANAAAVFKKRVEKDIRRQDPFVNGSLVLRAVDPGFLKCFMQSYSDSTGLRPPIKSLDTVMDSLFGTDYHRKWNSIWSTTEPVGHLVTFSGDENNTVWATADDAQLELP
jgi:hypothetical protein